MRASALRSAVGAAVGDHHGVAAGGARGFPPVVDERLAQRGGGWSRDEPTVVTVGVSPCLNVVAAKIGERVAIPRGALASDLMELDRPRCQGLIPIGAIARQAAPRRYRRPTGP
jgi:hypothetical protein